METTTSLLATLGLLLALGLRHGLDPDHIAAVDSLTRLRFQANAFWSARLTGFQFALGHSLTVFLATLVFYWQVFQLPDWLDQVGLWISSVVLVWLAVVNLKHCLKGGSHGHLASPLKAWLMRAMGPLAHPMGVGFAFAISFDSLAQAGLMAAKGHELGGVGALIFMPVCFGLGMLCADTCNGLVMHLLVKNSQRVAQHSARWMSGLIAVLSLLVVAAGHLSLQLPALEAAMESAGGWLGLGLTGLVGLGLLISHWHHKRHARAA
jgi:high-affinity nickel-transport protein